MIGFQFCHQFIPRRTRFGGKVVLTVNMAATALLTLAIPAVARRGGALPMMARPFVAISFTAAHTANRTLGLMVALK